MFPFSEPISTCLIAAAVGLLIGPALAAWATHSARRLSLLTEGWWRGGQASPRRIGVVCTLSGALFALFGYRFSGGATLPAWCWLSAAGLVLAVVDLECQRLPHRVVGATATGGVICLGGAAAYENRWGVWFFSLAAGLGIFLAAGLVQLAAPSHTGGGDTMLSGALALYLGWFGWPGLIRGLLVIAVLTAVTGSAVFLLGRRRFDAKFPAGPTMILGALIGVLIA